jgi:hypothetical protein
VPKPFDATLNAILDARPRDWADYLGARFGLPTPSSRSTATSRRRYRPTGC